MAAEMEEAAVVRGGVVNMMKVVHVGLLEVVEGVVIAGERGKSFTIEATRKH